jgi:hypothetical protein
MSVVLNGKLINILPQQTGTGKNGAWVKQDFIIETSGEYPRKICISAWGDKAGEVAGLNAGDELQVSVNIESREFNEKWYTDVRAWRIEKTAQAPGEANPSFDDIPPPGEDDDLLPF